jgi:hypothetical protein
VRIGDLRFDNRLLVTNLDQPVCVRSDKESIGEGSGWFSSTYDADDEKLVVERLVEGDNPALELTLVDPRWASTETATLLGRGRIPLVRVDTGAELPAYAYRTASEVHVLVVRGFNEPRDAFPDPMMGTRACGFLHMVLTGTNDSRTASVVEAHAMDARARWLPSMDKVWDYELLKRPAGDAPPFAVNASVSKVSRDPEPVLSVTVRARGPVGPGA